MNQIEQNIQEQEKKLEKSLAELPKRKWEILPAIIICIIATFVLPYFPFRTGTLAERLGYNNSVIIFGILFLITVPIGCFMHFQKINYKINDIEVDLEILRRKKKQREE